MHEGVPCEGGARLAMFSGRSAAAEAGGRLRTGDLRRRAALQQVQRAVPALVEQARPVIDGIHAAGVFLRAAAHSAIISLIFGTRASCSAFFAAAPAKSPARNQKRGNLEVRG